MPAQRTASPIEVREMLYAAIFAPAAYAVVTLFGWLILGLVDAVVGIPAVDGLSPQLMFVAGPCVGGVIAFPATWLVGLPAILIMANHGWLSFRTVLATAVLVAWSPVAAFCLWASWMGGIKAASIAFISISAIVVPGSSAVATALWSLYCLFTGKAFCLLPTLRLDTDHEAG